LGLYFLIFAVSVIAYTTLNELLEVFFIYNLIIPLQTPYDGPLSHSTYVTDKQTTDTRHVLCIAEG